MVELLFAPQPPLDDRVQILAIFSFFSYIKENQYKIFLGKILQERKQIFNCKIVRELVATKTFFTLNSRSKHQWQT